MPLSPLYATLTPTPFVIPISNGSGLLDDWVTPGLTNPMTTDQDIIVGGIGGTPDRLALGAIGYVLTVGIGGLIEWAASSGGFVNPMTTSQDLIVGGVGGAAGRLGVGSLGQVLTVGSGGIVDWETPSLFTGNLVVPYGDTLTFLDNGSTTVGAVMSNEAGAILCTREIRMRGTNALFGTNNVNPTDRSFVADSPGDPFTKFIILGTGTMAWGTGAAAEDVNFARVGVGSMAISGATKGIRFLTNTLGAYVEGVDNTASTYQKLSLNGLTMDFGVGASATVVASLATTGWTVDLGAPGTLPTVITAASNIIRLGNVDNGGAFIQADTYSTTAGQGFWLQGRYSGGTRASPAATPNGARIVELEAFGFDTALTTTPSATFRMIANSIWASGNRETAFLWTGTPNASATAGTWLALSGVGLALTVGNFTATGTLASGAVAGVTGALLLKGLTSGTVTFSVNDVAGTWTMKLPASGGTNGYVLGTDGSGNTSWVVQAALDYLALQVFF